MKSKIVFQLSIAASVLAFATSSWAAEPYIGYVYPAGGCQGTTIRVTIGGQQLRGARSVIVSGKGVEASVVDFVGAGGPLNSKQQDELKMRLQELLTSRGRATKRPPKLTGTSPRIELPDLPELRNLESLSGTQLQQIRDKFLNPTKKTKPPIAENLTLDIKVDQNAEPGDRELRVETANGLTNPIVFQVGRTPEVTEPDPDDLNPYVTPVSQVPALFNGRIMPGQTDSYPMQLKKGQNLVISAQARHLIPYLADAVPGWFQAMLTLCDQSGKELVSSDHSGFDPDPVINYTVPEDGNYTLQVRDTLYRGRKDFIYRVEVAEKDSLPAADNPDIDQNSFFPAPTSKEIEPNNSGVQAQAIKYPCTLRGSIEQTNDVDVYKFNGKAGDEIVAETCARRLGSQLDSLIRIISASGKVIAFNDDSGDRSIGLLTHKADSYVSVKLPTTGVYYVQVSDAQRHGGENYGYELRVSPKDPDFALRMTPSSVNIPSGCSVPVTVYAFRKDGWKGDIDISLKNARSGFTLSGGRIPAGKDSVIMTLTAPSLRHPRMQSAPVKLEMEGKAVIAGKTITHPVIPAQNMMQAFAYQHLVPSKELYATVVYGRSSAVLSRSESGPVKIAAGGQSQVSFKISPEPQGPVQVVINNAPAGLSIVDTKTTANGITCTIKADSKQAPYSDNLIFEVFAEVNTQRNASKPAKKQRVSIGVLPAIPAEITKN